MTVSKAKVSSTSTMSKTKAKATTRKPKIAAAMKITGGTPDQVLMAKLMEQHVMDNHSVSFADIMKSLDMNDHNTKWRNAWKDLEKQGYMKQSAQSGGFFTSGFGLTVSGVDVAASDEYKEAMKNVNNSKLNAPRTNQELHDQIKGKLMNKRGDEIFDLLVKHGSLSRMELSSMLGISDRGAHFSYALQQLKELGYVEFDPTTLQQKKNKKLRLSSSAFVTPVKYAKPNSIKSEESTKEETVASDESLKISKEKETVDEALETTKDDTPVKMEE